MKQSNKNREFSKLFLCLFFVVSYSSNANVKYSFNPDLINKTNSDIYLDYFNDGSFPAGDYIVDIYINDEYKKTAEIKFNESDDDKLMPCLSDDLLSSLGVKKEFLNNSATENFLSKKWSYLFDVYQQTLSLKIPISDLNKPLDGIAPKYVWDDGVFAAYLNYDLNHSEFKNKSNNNNQNYTYLNFSPGLNINEWRLRNNTYFTRSTHNKARWENASNYIERGFYDINSRVIIGDFMSSSGVFDSLNLRGINFKTDEEMIPVSLRSVTPVIRGIANTQAFVEVEYDGYIIYTTTVDSGVFEINDLPYIEGDGVYKVIINESDGSKRIMMVPFVQAPLSLKKGFSKYNISFGRYRSIETGTKGPDIFESSYAYGLSENTTIYTGLQYSNIYKSYLFGMSFGLGEFGGVSLDGVYSDFKLNNHKEQKYQGGGGAIKYTKDFQNTKTNIYLSNRFYSKEFIGLSETYNFEDIKNKKTKKNSLSIGVSQYTDNYGGVRFSYNNDIYWDNKKYSYLDLSYNINHNGWTYSIGYNQNKFTSSNKDKVIDFSITFPLKLNNYDGMSTSYNYINKNRSDETHRLGLFGSAYDNTLYWGVEQKYHNSENYGFSGYANYRHQYGQFGGGIVDDKNSFNYNANLSGSALITKHGLVLGEKISQSTALLIAPGASNVDFLNKAGIKTDSKGRALISGLTPYHENLLSLNPVNMPDDVEIIQTDIKVTPSAGAVVIANYYTNKGFKALIKLVNSNGYKKIPFGAIASVEDGNIAAGIVGDNGEIFLNGLPETGVLQVKWGNTKNDSCSVIFDENKIKNESEWICS